MSPLEKSSVWQGTLSWAETSAIMTRFLEDLP